MCHDLARHASEVTPAAMTGLTRKEWSNLPADVKKIVAEDYYRGRLYKSRGVLLVWDPQEDEFDALVIGSQRFEGGESVWYHNVVATIQHIHADHIETSYGHPKNEEILHVRPKDYIFLRHATVSECSQFAIYWHPDQVNKRRQAARQFVL